MKGLIITILVDKAVPFHEPLKRINLKTFAFVCIVKKVKNTKNKEMQIKVGRNIFGQLVLLSIEHNIDLQVTFLYSFGPVPFTLATADGIPFKTYKAKLLPICFSVLLVFL